MKATNKRADRQTAERKGTDLRVRVVHVAAVLLVVRDRVDRLVLGEIVHPTLNKQKQAVKTAD